MRRCDVQQRSEGEQVAPACGGDEHRALFSRSVTAMPCRVPAGKVQSSFFCPCKPASEKQTKTKAQVCAPSVYTSEADARNKKTLAIPLRWWRRRAVGCVVIDPKRMAAIRSLATLQSRSLAPLQAFPDVSGNNQAPKRNASWCGNPRQKFNRPPEPVVSKKQNAETEI